jgi:hypothetical protein
VNGQVPLDSNSTAILFAFSHTVPTFRQQLNHSAFEDGRLLTIDEGSSALFGGIAVAQLINQTTGLFRIRLGAAFNLTSIGISIIQVTRVDHNSAPSVVFLGGLNSSPFVYPVPLRTTLNLFGTSVAVASGAQRGYNPLSTFDNLQGSIDCFALFKCDSSFQYQYAPETIVSSPDCRTTRVCNNQYEYETSAPTYSTNRICQNLTVCFDASQLSLWTASQGSGSALQPPSLQFESVAPTATTNRNCTNVTTCQPNQVTARVETAYSDRVCAGL